MCYIGNCIFDLPDMGLLLNKYLKLETRGWIELFNFFKDNATEPMGCKNQSTFVLKDITRFWL